VFEQKLNYIHYNPVSAGMCANPEDYYYSSARFYYDGIDSFGMLTHYSGNQQWSYGSRLSETRRGALGKVKCAKYERGNTYGG